MSDRLNLARAIEDAGIERGKAEAVASVIFNVIHDNVATRYDVQTVRGEVQALQTETQAVETRLHAEIQGVEIRLSARLDLIEHRLLTRLGGLVVVAAGLLFAALRYTGH